MEEENAELSQEEIETIKRLRLEGLSYRSISKELNRPLSTVYRYAKDIKPETFYEKDVLDIVNAKLKRIEKLERQVERQNETLKDLIELVFANILGICRVLELSYNEEKAKLIKDQLLENLNTED
jgi:IS30 family transposase